MKRLALITLIVLLEAIAHAQGGGYTSAAVQSFAGFKNPNVTVSSAQCTGTPCTPLATIFTDNTLTTVAQNPFTGDNNGNFKFFGAPGWYTVTVCPTTGSTNCLIYLALVPPDANNTAVMSIGIVQSTTALPAQTGNYRLASSDSVCWRNAANNADVCLSKNALDQIVGASASSPLITSSPNPAATGVVRLAAGDTMCFRNSANTGDICLSKNVSDQIIGASASTPIISTSTNPAQTGQVRLGGNDTICWRNAGNTADVCLSENASSQIVGASASTPLISSSSNPAATGVIRLASGDSACFRNQGNSGDICWSLNSNNQIVGIVNIGTLSIPAASCVGTTAASNFDLPASNAPTAACTGTNENLAYLSFPAGSTSTAYTHVLLPITTWSGNIDVAFQWFTAATTNSTTWQIQTGCATVNSTVMTTGPALNTANTVSTTSNPTANTMTQSTISAITTTGCSAGQDMFVAISRSGSDTNTSSANLLDVVLTIRKVTQ